MPAKTITLIDLSSIFWQAWKGLEHKPQGNAFNLTIHSVQKHVNGDNPVAICIDMPPYCRKTIDPNYKADREARPKSAYQMLYDTIEKLRQDGFPILGREKFEADDIIASIVRVDCLDHYIKIISSDKDLLQVVGEQVTVTSPMTGKTYETNDVIERFGVEPWQVRFVLALTGDNADNIPGVKGVGIKHASRLLNEHGWTELLNLLDVGDPDNQITPPSIRQKLLNSQDDLIMSEKLVRLMDQVPIDYDSIFEPRVPKPKKEESDPMEEPTPVDMPEEEEQAPAPKQTAIVKAEKWAMQLEPTDVKSAYKVAAVLYKSGLYSNIPNEQSIFAIIMRGRELGMGATTALSSFHVIQGRPTMSADLIVALVLNSGKCDYFKLVESTDIKATYKTHRKGDPDSEPTVLSFDIEKAKRMELASKNNWKKQPDTMLRHRAAAALAREVYPDVTLGLYTPDELSNGEYIEAEAEVVG